MALQYDIKQAEADANLTQDQLAARSQAATIQPSSAVISVDSLMPTKAIQLPQATNLDNSGAMVANVQAGQKSLQDYIKQMTPEPTALDNSQTTILNRIAELTGQDAGKQAYQTQQENQFGLPQFQTQLSDLNSQIQSGIAELTKSEADYQARNAALEANSAGITAGILGGQQAALQRQYLAERAAKAADVGLLQARAAGLSGQIQTALSLASRATDMAYQPIENNLKILQAQLAAIQPSLDQQQKIQAAALEKKYQDEQQRIADEKATRKDAVSFALQNNVNTPFYTHAGTVYNTTTGQAYSTPEEFFAAGGARDFSNAPEVNLQAKPAEVSPGNTLVDPATGRVIYQAPARATSSGGSTSSGSGLSDIQQIAEAIISGNQPPVLTGLYGKSAAVRAELQRQGYNLTAATQDYTATQKYLTTLNGAQQTRLRQAVNFTAESLDLLGELNSKAEEAMTRSGITNFAKVQKTAALQGVFGQEVKSAFTQLDNQIGDLVSELATVYKGGNSSTDESLKQAGKQLSSDWDYQTLQDNIELVRRNLQIRINSINNTEAAGTGSENQYNPNDNQNTNDPMNIR